MKISKANKKHNQANDSFGGRKIWLKQLTNGIN